MWAHNKIPSTNINIQSLNKISTCNWYSFTKLVHKY